MEEFLDRAERLLRDIAQSRNISTLVVLHHLRDLSKVLDKLKLYDECRLTGNCALDLAEALGRRSLEFRHEHAETLALIAGLTIYRPRASTLFTQAISICEEVVANDASHTNKLQLLIVLNRAGYWAPCTQRLERAIQLMTKELPPTILRPYFRSIIYHNYGIALLRLKQNADAVEAYHEAISIRRQLATNDPAKYNPCLIRTLMCLLYAFNDLGRYGDAIAACKEAMNICTAMTAHDPLQYNKLMAEALCDYGFILGNSKRVSEAAEVEKQAISLCRNLAQTGNEHTQLLSRALHNYGHSCGSLGQYGEAVFAYQESILLLRVLAATDSEQEKDLIESLHDMSNSFLALDKHAEANAAAIEALERNLGRILETCDYAPNFKSCFTCQKAVITDAPGDGSPPLPYFLANYSPQPTSARGSLTPAETSTSAHITPTNAACLMGLAQPGVACGAPVHIHWVPLSLTHHVHLPANHSSRN